MLFDGGSPLAKGHSSNKNHIFAAISGADIDVLPQWNSYPAMKAKREPYQNADFVIQPMAATDVFSHSLA